MKTTRKTRTGRPTAIAYQLCKGESVKIRLKENDPWIHGIVEDTVPLALQIFVKGEDGANYQFHYNEYPTLVTR